MQTPSPKMSAFRNDLVADGQGSGDFGEKFELPQIKREEPEFPIHQNREEQLPINKEENYFTWSTGEPMKSEDDLGVASRGAEPANTSTRPQIKEEEEPEFTQHQHMREEEPPIKKEEQDVIGSTGEPFKSEDDLGLASRGMDPPSVSTWPQIKEEEPEFPQHQMREKQLPIKKEEDDFTWSTGEPFKREEDLGGASGGAEPPHGSCSTEGWQAEHLIAPLSDSDDLLYDDEGLKKNPSGDKLCKCSYCGKTFGKKSTLKRHMVIHIGEKPFACSVCGKTFTEKGSLKIHIRTHTGEKPCSCSVCGKTFTQKRAIKGHTRTHTGEKPFPCPFCGQAFREKKHLKIHTRIHTGEKPFLSVLCGTYSVCQRAAAGTDCDQGGKGPL